MQVGDLLEWKGKRWLAVLSDRQTRMMTLLSEDGTRITVHVKLDKSNHGCVRICNPSKDWPVIMHKQRVRLGKLVSVQRSPSLGADLYTLRPFEEWIAGDPEQLGGGPIFFSPDLDLHIGEVLVARFEKGTSKIVVPTSFSTLGDRVAKANAKPTELKTAYDRLLDDSHFDDD